MREMLHSKLKNVFQEQNQKIFDFSSDEIIKSLITEEYKSRALSLIPEDLIDDFEDNISSDDFVTFVKTVIDLNLHMILNDPPITVKLLTSKEREQKDDVLQKFDFWQFKKADYYCIDGFPTEGMPGVVVLPPPYRGNYIYQGLKPAVIVLNNDNLEDPDLFGEGKK